MAEPRKLSTSINATMPSIRFKNKPKPDQRGKLRDRAAFPCGSYAPETHRNHPRKAWMEESFMAWPAFIQ
jgi:hypothetical protein